jgi:hypothetical protein
MLGHNPEPIVILAIPRSPRWLVAYEMPATTSTWPRYGQAASVTPPALELRYLCDGPSREPVMRPPKFSLSIRLPGRSRYGARSPPLPRRLTHAPGILRGQQRGVNRIASGRGVIAFRPRNLRSHASVRRRRSIYGGHGIELWHSRGE